MDLPGNGQEWEEQSTFLKGMHLYMIRYDTIWCDVMWCDAMWYDMIYYGFIQCYDIWYISNPSINCSRPPPTPLQNTPWNHQGFTKTWIHMNDTRSLKSKLNGDSMWNVVKHPGTVSKWIHSNTNNMSRYYQMQYEYINDSLKYIDSVPGSQLDSWIALNIFDSFRVWAIGRPRTPSHCYNVSLTPIGSNGIDYII